MLIVAPLALRSCASRARAARRARATPASAAAPDGASRVLGVGEVLPLPLGARGPASVPVDVARTIEELLDGVPLDFVHVHEPFAPERAARRRCATRAR